MVDASIFPGQVATNPSAPIMIAAERAIELILANPAVGQRVSSEIPTSRNSRN